MEKYKLYIFAVLPLLVILSLSSFIYQELTSTKIKNITSDLKLIDANLDHNQALDVIELAKEQDIEIPSTIINFDTHSDMYIFEEIDPKYGARVSNWLNIFFAKHPNANELYWVMPEAEATDSAMNEEFLLGDKPNYPGSLYGNTFPTSPKIEKDVNQQAYEQDFLLNTNNGWMKEITNTNAEIKQGFKKIKVVTCTEKTLPDFKYKKVILSIDSDYISNSGFDTLAGFTNNRTNSEINKAISKMLSTIKRKKIRPQIITLTLSPEYVPPEDREQLFDFMQEFVKHSGKKDILQQYSHQFDSPKTNKKYSGF